MYPIETCFSFLIHCWPIRARECDTPKISKKNRKSVISPILQHYFNYFLQNLPGCRILWMKKRGKTSLNFLNLFFLFLAAFLK